MARLEWLGIEEVGFGLTVLAWNEASRRRLREPVLHPRQDRRQQGSKSGKDERNEEGEMMKCTLHLKQVGAPTVPSSVF
jgi:hypothetical protein